MASHAAKEVTAVVGGKKFKQWSELQKVTGLASDKPSRRLEWRQDLVTFVSGDQTCNSVDWACIVKSKPNSSSSNHRWVLGLRKACDVGFWVFGMFGVDFEGLSVKEV